MKITEIMLSEGWGGAERLFVELCTGLAAAGHELQVICRPGFVRGGALQGVTGITCLTIPARGKWDLLSLLRMKRAIAAFAPQLIHAHLVRATWMAGHIGRRLQIPTVTTTHNQIKAKHFNKIEYFTTITRSLASYLQQQGVAPERIRYIPNFSLFAPVTAPAPRREGPPVFISLGRFVTKKGYRFLIEAFARLVKEIGPARLLLAGSGPLTADLKSLVNALGLAEQVEFLGWVDDTEGLFAAGDIFVLPSLDEPFGIVLLEAMAKGKPIVTTRTGGPLDLLDEGLAYFVDPGSAADLARGMAVAVRDPQGCLERAKKSLDLYRAKYTRDAVLPDFVDFFTTIVAAGKR
jgi:glycosyltransferase involved in cell wall biosynthesis